jgi:acyl-CoA thioester hydrolase
MSVAAANTREPVFTAVASARMAEWPYVRRERVRFRDCDSMGHMNNAVYSTFLEEARIEVVGDLADFILARVEIDFRAQLRAGDEVEVLTRCSHIGTKSLVLEHELRVDGRPAAEARSVLVGYDYEHDRSVALSDEVRARLSGVPASA